MPSFHVRLFWGDKQIPLIRLMQIEFASPYQKEAMAVFEAENDALAELFAFAGSKYVLAPNERKNARFCRIYECAGNDGAIEKILAEEIFLPK